MNNGQGDAGLRMCMIRRNLFSRASGIVDEDGTELLTCSIIRERDLDFATDAEVVGSARRLAALHGTIPPGEFQLREMAAGFTHKTHSILNDQSLSGIVRPVTIHMHDWTRGFLVNGVFNTVVFLLFAAAVNASFKDIWSHVERYIHDWIWPGLTSVSKALAECFSAKRGKSSRKAKSFKASASDGLALYPVLALFVSNVLMRDGANSPCRLECLAFLALCDVLDMLTAVPLNIVTPEMLRGAVDAFLSACIAAEWEDYTHSKFHWSIHLAAELARHSALYTCFVQERKHKVAKRYGNEILNTVAFERSVLGEVHSHHLAELRSGKVLHFGECMLRDPKRAKPPLVALLKKALGEDLVDAAADDVLWSNVAQLLPAGVCCRRDIVLIKSMAPNAGSNALVAGEVWLHASVSGQCITLVNLLRPLTGPGEHRWSAAEERLEMVATEDVLTTCCHTAVHAGRPVRVIVPWHLKGWAVADR